MPTIDIADPEVFAEVIEARRASGQDVRDEVWEGTYLMMPLGDLQHQFLATRIAAALTQTLDWSHGHRIAAGANVSDLRPPDDWRKNFRIPDVAVYLASNPAEARDSHYVGGPDLAVEIVSPGDRSLEKLGFYASIGTRELLVIHRKPWMVELFRLEAGELIRVAEDDNGRVVTRTVAAKWAIDPDATNTLVLEMAERIWRLTN